MPNNRINESLETEIPFHSSVSLTLDYDRECRKQNEKPCGTRLAQLSHLFSAPARRRLHVPLVGLSPQGTTGNLSAKIATGCRCVFFFCPLDAVRLSLFRDKMGFPQREPRLNVICRKDNVGITRRMPHDEEYYAVQEFSNLRTRSARRRMGYRRSACPKYYLLVEFVVVERQMN